MLARVERHRARLRRAAAVFVQIAEQAARTPGRDRRRRCDRSGSPTPSSQARAEPARARARRGRRRSRGALVGILPGPPDRRCSSRCSAVFQTGAAYVPIDPTYPARAPGVHARRQRRRPSCVTQEKYLGTIDSGAVLGDLRRPRLGARSRAQPERAAGHRGRPRRTAPTSSTPPARPVGPRASRSTHRASVEPARLHARAARDHAADDVLVSVDHARRSTSPCRTST